MNNYKKLVNFFLKKDLTVSVFDGECFSVKRSTDKKEILEDISSVDISELRVRDKEGQIVAWCQIVEGEVADYTMNDLMTEWEALDDLNGLKMAR